MLEASEFFGSSLDDLRTYFGIAVSAKPKINRKSLEGGCMLLTPKTWRKVRRREDCEARN